MRCQTTRHNRSSGRHTFSFFPARARKKIASDFIASFTIQTWMRNSSRRWLENPAFCSSPCLDGNEWIRNLMRHRLWTRTCRRKPTSSRTTLQTSTPHKQPGRHSATSLSPPQMDHYRIWIFGTGEMRASESAITFCIEWNSDSRAVSGFEFRVWSSEFGFVDSCCCLLPSSFCFLPTDHWLLSLKKDRESLKVAAFRIRGLV